MKLAFSTLGCTDWTFEDILTTAKRFSIDAVELRGLDREHVSPAFSKNERRTLREEFSRRGVEICCISAYTHFSMPLREEREKNGRELLSFVDLSADLGCGFVRTFAGDFPNQDPERVYDYVAEALNRIGKRIERGPVKILVETHDAVSSGRSLKRLLERLETNAVGVLWDIAHSYWEDETPEETWELLGPWIEHVHIKDGYRSPCGTVVHSLPGEGKIPIRRFRDLLESKGYERIFSLEWERKWHPQLPDLREALPLFTSIMKKT